MSGTRKTPAGRDRGVKGEEVLGVDHASSPIADAAHEALCEILDKGAVAILIIAEDREGIIRQQFVPNLNSIRSGLLALADDGQ
ncbi:MAG: hypothetical protein KGL35_31715 [Bradyrhizobium sp.]|nr:hypothetical protein [Bradyrhizobium sp.]